MVGQRTLDPLSEVRNPRGATILGTASVEQLGDVVKWFNTAVCKTSIHRFESGRRLHFLSTQTGLPPV